MSQCGSASAEVSEVAKEREDANDGGGESGAVAKDGSEVSVPRYSKVNSSATVETAPACFIKLLAASGTVSVASSTIECGG